MKIGLISGHSRITGEEQGYRGLPLRDEVTTCEVQGGDVPIMVSAWIPDEEELAELNAGKAIYVTIYGNTPPPMSVDVGEKAEPYE